MTSIAPILPVPLLKGACQQVELVYVTHPGSLQSIAQGFGIISVIQRNSLGQRCVQAQSDGQTVQQKVVGTQTKVEESLSLGYFLSFIFYPDPRLVVNSDKLLTFVGDYPKLTFLCLGVTCNSLISTLYCFAGKSVPFKIENSYADNMVG